MSENIKPIFDDYKDVIEVDCEECEHIYTGACDGASEGSSKPCKSFKATRRVVTLKELDALREDVKYLKRSCILNAIVNSLIAISMLLHVWGC